MDYVGAIFRPPSEADSLLVQATVGCSHNTCAFCAMYADKTFRAKKWETIQADLDEGLAEPYYRRVFLCDGDALILSTNKLVRILRYIKEHGPQIERVGVYGDARGVLAKSVEELRELKDAGLGIVYHGLESGDDEVLRRIRKGSTAAEQAEAGRRVKQAGILYSAIVLLGAGGEELSEQHARNTAALLTAADPDYVGCLMLTLVLGTPLYEDAEAGRFVLPDKWGLLRELRTIVAESDFSRCHFTANHASNYLPIKADMPQDKPRVLALIDDVIARHDDRTLKPEWMRGL
ncbi:MAG: radical SAM protein [Myxococcales bacterium]|nr:MAG: radical SAM protein [Myxococcales bacterium]